MMSGALTLTKTAVSAGICAPHIGDREPPIIGGQRIVSRRLDDRALVQPSHVGRQRALHAALQDDAVALEGDERALLVAERRDAWRKQRLQSPNARRGGWRRRLTVT